jgi:hypothetical protein
MFSMLTDILVDTISDEIPAIGPYVQETQVTLWKTAAACYQQIFKHSQSSTADGFSFARFMSM